MADDIATIKERIRKYERLLKEGETYGFDDPTDETYIRNELQRLYLQLDLLENEDRNQP